MNKYFILTWVGFVVAVIGIIFPGFLVKTILYASGLVMIGTPLLIQYIRHKGKIPLIAGILLYIFAVIRILLYFR